MAAGRDDAACRALRFRGRETLPGPLLGCHSSSDRLTISRRSCRIRLTDHLHSGRSLVPCPVGTVVVLPGTGRERRPTSSAKRIWRSFCEALPCPRRQRTSNRPDKTIGETGQLVY